MEIQAVGAPASLMPLAPERKLSKTTLKTHALVVLSYLLIGIGIALACASVYMATMMSPMLAMATPVAPIALGILLKPSETSGGIFSTSKAPVYIKGQPLGFRNEDGSTCWLNSALQVLFGSSSGKELMGNLSVTNFSLFPLRSAFKRSQAELAEENGRPVSSISTANIRSWLSRMHTEIAKSGVQEDPMALFEELYNLSGKFLPIQKQVNKGKPVNESDFSIPLMMLSGSKTPFKTLFEGYFSEFAQDSGTTIRKWFTKAPVGFLVQAKRITWDEASKKITAPMDFPMNLELSKAQCLEGNRKYSPDAFIVHQGSGSESGHYVAYVRRNGYWWYASDHHVTQVSDSVAASKLPSAYIVHYAQT